MAIDYSNVFDGLEVETNEPCEAKDYHLPGKCGGPVRHLYGYGHLVVLCDAHYATAPDPRRIPVDWDGKPETLLPTPEE